MEHDKNLDNLINELVEGRSEDGICCGPGTGPGPGTGTAVVAWALDRVAMGLGEIADAIRNHTARAFGDDG